ncbi:MAG TPA: dockerin type I domain-containing protein, partial [Candidatus Angelobacter sp.]|nr:dockerin type I domain-containing protein [Candidatus Angelobacter sp.]
FMLMHIHFVAPVLVRATSRSLLFLLGFALFITHPLAGAGLTTYVYVGAQLNQFVGTSCPPTCHLTGSFTVAQPLPPNLVQDVGGSGAFTPLSFTFTDGVTTFTQVNSPLSGFAVHTDGNGNIVQWGMFMAGPGGGAGLFLFYGGIGSEAQQGVNIDSYQAYFFSSTSPGGAWSIASANSGNLRESLKSYTDSINPLDIPWNPPFPDTNYTAACTAETTAGDFLLPTITARSTNGMQVSPSDGGPSSGALNCFALPDFDSSDLRHGRASFSGFPASVTVAWNQVFSNTNYTAVCTVETHGSFASGFTSVITTFTPGSVDVINGGYDTGTMHCIAVPDSDTSNLRHTRVAVFTSPPTVTVPWTPVFPDPFYVSVCGDEAPTSADSALAIKANSKLPGSLQVIPELPASGGVVHCMASHISGDVNGDGVVNCVDLEAVKASFGKKLGQPGFNPKADVNGDGIVNVLDLSIVAKQVPAGTVCK